MEHLEAYLKGYARAATTARERYYIDAFAGCGDCVLRVLGIHIEGSARRALKVQPPFTGCFFIEQNPALASHLRSQMASERNVHVFEGDCNEVIPAEVLPRIPRRAASLAFLDPTGAQLQWRTIQTLAGHRLGRFKMELLILYPYDMFIARWLKLDTMAPALTLMFGGDHWKRALQESTANREDTVARRERFVQLYCDGLRSLGYQYVDTLGPLYRSGHHPLYHVIFAGDHPVGQRIMRDVWSRARPVPGELGYKPMF